MAHLRRLAASAIQPGNSLVAPEIHVAWDTLKSPDREPDQWLMYGRDLGNQRFSPLQEIIGSGMRGAPISFRLDGFVWSSRTTGVWAT